MRFVLFTLFLCCLFASCVNEYKIPEEVTSLYEKKLVVDGRILADEMSVVYLTYTTPVGSFDKGEPALNADITIVGQNGYESPKAEYDKENKRYLIPTYNLSNDTQYAINIKHEGETYQSEFQPILDTPEIERVTWEEKEDGLALYVTTQGENSGSRNYMWTFDEDWEFHSEMDFTRALSVGGWYYNKELYPIENEGKNPYYYCWMHNESSLIHIYDTKNLNENKVIDHQFLHIPIDDIRISYIYSILVKQANISDEVYEYYRLMKLYTQESSGIFTPMPTEVKGNVKCISNPDKKINGVVIASKMTSKRIFVYAKDFKNLVPEHSVCNPAYASDKYTGDYTDNDWRRSWQLEINLGAFIYVIYSDINDILDYNKLDKHAILYPPICMDCRKVQNATKKRPNFWPNNHE